MVEKKAIINADGSQIENVEIIRVGLSVQNNLYSAEALEEAASKFEGAPVVNQSPAVEDIGISPGNVCGHISDVEFTDGARWCGKLQIYSEYTAEILARIKEGRQPRIRIDISASISRGTQDGEEIQVVDKIHAVNCIVLDWEDQA